MKFMNLALEIAKKSDIDLPIGAVIVKNGEIVATAHNLKEKESNSTLHAELVAINEAHKKLNSKILDGCEIYVTLEPCPMCMWAIINARIEKLYFGAYDFKYGAGGSVLDLKKIANSKIEIKGGILEEECESLIKGYFKGLRDEK
ncbi:nucleoside deaminase [bacterium]|nr:nucleoside deaminase [bacterium]